MNYTSQLRGWAVDRAISIAQIGKEAVTTAAIIDAAKELINYVYVVQEDIEQTENYLEELKQTKALEEKSHAGGVQ